MPCRGSGKVISNLGGTPSTVTCPWCQGGGVRVPETDAQAHWGGGDGEKREGDAGAARAETGASAETPAA
jgi:hypothetical protein